MMLEVEREALAREYASELGLTVPCEERWRQWVDERLPEPDYRRTVEVEQFAAVGYMVRDLKENGCILGEIVYAPHAKVWSVLVMYEGIGAWTGKREYHAEPAVAMVRSAIHAMKERKKHGYDKVRAPGEAAPGGATPPRAGG